MKYDYDFFWFPSLQSVCFAFILFLSIVTNRFSPNKEEYSVKLWWFIDGPADRYYIDNILSLNLIYFSSHFLFIADKIWNDWFCMSTRIVTFKFAVNFSMFSIRIEKILSNMRNESEHNICDLCAAFWLRVCAKMPRIHFENYQVYISCVSRSALKQGAINERTDQPTNIQSKCKFRQSHGECIICIRQLKCCYFDRKKRDSKLVCFTFLRLNFGGKVIRWIRYLIIYESSIPFPFSFRTQTHELSNLWLHYGELP